MTKTFRARIRALAAAATLALTVVSLSAGHAHANQNGTPVNEQLPCAIPGSVIGAPEDWVFLRPGTLIGVKLSDGRLVRLECGADGEWIVTYVRPPTGVRPVSALPGGGVLGLR